MRNLRTGWTGIRVGDRVYNRGRQWTVATLDHFGDCALAGLTSRESGSEAVTQTVVMPFDRLTPVVPRHRLRLVGRARWRRLCRTLLAHEGGAPILRTALTARMELLPHQLDPVMALVRGLGSRVLIADGVGLGKTVQAALIVAELRARRAAARVLILTPAGVRDQWRSELLARFDLAPEIIDATALRVRQRHLPVGVNPWGTAAIVIASTDYVKRPEILRAVADAHWDAIVVDEAHGCTHGSDRHAAVAALCRMATHVVLLTATPHSGDALDFRALCDIGARGDDLLIFRRTRADADLPDQRRVHQLLVRPTAEERRLRSTLEAFAAVVARDATVADERVALVLAMLRKRALSSASSLARSILRRLAMLGDGTPAAGAQLALPFEADGDMDPADAMPEWREPVMTDAAEERVWLARLAADASLASANESKLNALSRLLRRVREPVIVFTEYRDTLVHVRNTVVPHGVLLHGGLSRAERLASLQRFAEGGVLLATDAAGEGLNLHAGCRTVINLELPWNPMRLEQRIGRVDRIGQPKRVHAFHLIARESDEMAVLERLDARIAAAQVDVGAADPLRNARHDAGRSMRGDASSPQLRPTSEAARDEANRLHWARRLRPFETPWLTAFEGGPLATRCRPVVRQALDGRHLVVWLSMARSRHGHVVAVHLSALTFTAHRQSRQRDLLNLVDRLAHLAVDARVHHWRQETRLAHRAFWERVALRRGAIAHDFDLTPQLTQPGLFDRRAIKTQARLTHVTNAVSAEWQLQVDEAQHWQAVVFEPPVAVLVLLP